MFIIIIFSFCTKKAMIMKEIPSFDFKKMIDKLEDGFSFEWRMKNKVMNFKSKGNYIGSGKYKMEGEVIIDGKKEELQDLNPFEILKVILGENDFKFREIKNGCYVFNFTANLFFLNPVSGFGKGEIIIKDSIIQSVICSGEDTYFSMVISEDKPVYSEYYIDYEGKIENITKRLVAFGEKKVSFKGNILKFKEVKEFDDRIFKQGKIEFLLLKNDYNGTLKDPIDTLFTYSIICTLNMIYKEVDKIYDQKGRPSVTISIQNNIEGYIGFFVDGAFVSCGLGKKCIYFPFKDEKERDLYYAIIISGELNGKIRNYRRLK